MCSSNQRGFIPPSNDAEQLFVKRIADLIRVVSQSGVARTTLFLNEREQALAVTQLNRFSQVKHQFYGGISSADRKMLCIYEDEIPADAFSISPIALKVSGDAAKLTHRDYLGALMALRLKRECIGDIILSNEGALVFVQKKFAQIIFDELFEIGRCHVSASICEQLPESTAPENLQTLTATVSSLRLDAILAAMLKISRGNAAELIRTKSVMVNHVEMTSVHDAVYEGDVFSVRGRGKFKLCEIRGKSKKDRTFVSYIQF